MHCSGRAQLEGSVVGVRVECLDELMMATDKRVNLVGGAIPYSQVNYARRKAPHETQISEITVFRHNGVAVPAGKLPDLTIRAPIKPDA